MTSFSSDLEHLLAGARAEGRTLLFEDEGLAFARALGLEVPVHRLARDVDAVAEIDLDVFPGSRLVIKVVAPGLLHKSDTGGVRVVEKERHAAVEAASTMARRFPGARGFLIEEFVEHDEALGGELLLGLRHTTDFGPVVVLGPGGVDAEHLARSLAPGRSTAILSPSLPAASRRAALLAKAWTPLACAPRRGRPPRLAESELLDLAERALAFAAAHLPGELHELEFNPVALTRRGPVALDAVVRLAGEAPPEASPPRPLAKLARLLSPRSVAVVGVSRRPNPGHIIVKNLLAEGFPRERVHVVKPGAPEVLGCPAVPRVEDLEEAVDLAVLAVDAGQAGDVLEDFVRTGKAESVVLIPGGLGERRGSEERAARIRRLLDEARSRPGGGPVVNGGNCLGVRSVPGRLDTMFIPRHKLRYAAVPPAPLAVISQSGAYAVARASALEALNPRYLISVGNQLDLTVGDYLVHLKDDPEVEVFACYVEGFQPGDGRRVLEASAEIAASGRTVVLYRAGRTAAGAAASASHTASVAGDYAVSRELLASAGVVVADTLDDFADLTELFCRLRGRRPTGGRLGAMSNAGFECVAIADSLGGLELATFGGATAGALGDLLGSRRLEGVVGVQNPFDVTPILDDEGFAEAARIVLADPGVDLGVVACVPLTGALHTIAAGEGHDEDVERPDGVASRLGELWRGTDKPWVAVVDAGPRFDALRRRLTAEGLMVLGSVDRAVRLLDLYAARASG